MVEPDEGKNVPEPAKRPEQAAPRPIAKTQPEPKALTDLDLWNLAFDEAEACSR